MLIYLVRHGETVWNRESRKQGHSDSPLTVRGIQQVFGVASLLRTLDLNEVVFHVSPLWRTQQTAAILCDVLNSKGYSVKKDLKEHSFGAWEGLTEEEINSQFMGELEARKNNAWDYKVLDGESYALISDRAKRYIVGLEEINSNVVVVTHEMMSKVLRGILLNMAPEQILSLDHPNEAVWCVDTNKVEARFLKGWEVPNFDGVCVNSTYQTST